MINVYANSLIFTIALECWKDNPNDRPDMQKVFSQLRLITIDNDDKMQIDEKVDLNDNEVITNELLLLYEKSTMYEEGFIQSVKLCITTKNKNEKEIFSYLLDDKNKPQNIFLLAN